MTSPLSIFWDFALISALLVMSHLLRSRLWILQYLYVPTPLIAGLLALACGPQLLDILPFSAEGDGKVLLGSYPNSLVAILFGTLFLGNRPPAAAHGPLIRGLADTFLYNVATELAQYGLALLIGVLVIGPLFPGINSGFALMLPGGFAGGHGTATAISTVLESHGWKDAKSVGFTFATIGLLSAVFGGMLLINIATRLHWTHLVDSPHNLPSSARRGFLPSSERASLGQETVSPLAFDPLAWHVALVLTTFAIAVGVKGGMQRVLPGNYDIPLYALTVICGAALQKLLALGGAGEYVDRHVIVRLGSTVSDYLIACGIASIRLQVLADYALPIAMMSLFGCVFSIAVLWYVGRKIYHNFWFERSIFVYGWNTGVVASAIMLLRIVDPRLRTRTLEDYGMAYMAIAPIDIALLVVLPPLVASDIIVVPALVLVAAATSCIVLSCYLSGWFPIPPALMRPGEEEVIESVESVAPMH